jgi:hypothetical protein
MHIFGRIIFISINLVKVGHIWFVIKQLWYVKKEDVLDRAQAASEGAIHGTSSRKESDDALGCVVVQRATNGNDREECSQMLCLRLGESMQAYWWRKVHDGGLYSCIFTVVVRWNWFY